LNNDLCELLSFVSKNGRKHEAQYVPHTETYTVLDSYSSEAKYSKDYEKPAAKGLIAATKDLWAEGSTYLQSVFPGQHSILERCCTPSGMDRLAGVWMGFMANRGSSVGSVQTDAHRNYKAAFFSKSCIYVFGDYTGGGLILWNLKAVVELESGDMFLFDDHLITHSNEQVVGLRHSLLASTQELVLKLNLEPKQSDVERKLRFEKKKRSHKQKKKQGEKTRDKRIKRKPKKRGKRDGIMNNRNGLHVSLASVKVKVENDD
jgi:hypothetical protein